MKILFKFKKIAFIGFVVIFLFTMPTFIQFCVEILGREQYDLDDFSIDTISDEEISKFITSAQFLSHTDYERDTSTGVSKADKTLDSDRVRITCEKMFGIAQVSATKASDCYIVLKIKSTLYSGRAEIVITKDDKEVLDRFELGGEVSRTYRVEGEHIYRVKVLAEDAKLEIETKREFHDDAK